MLKIHAYYGNVDCSALSRRQLVYHFFSFHIHYLGYNFIFFILPTVGKNFNSFTFNNCSAVVSAD